LTVVKQIATIAFLFDLDILLNACFNKVSVFLTLG